MSSPKYNKPTTIPTTTTHSSSQQQLPPPPKQIDQVGDYIIQEKIGQGSFATVYKAQHKYTNQIVAVKSVRRSKLTKKLLENLESEISILTAIRHNHIVGLIECQKTETNIYLVMEFCSLGDLSHYIKDVRTNKATKGPAGGLPERVVRHFLKQLANALEFLRTQNLVHRDIKPQNLLLVQPPPKAENEPSTVNDDLPILKVADFGFARFLPNASLADTLCGSPLYMGPEILSYKKYDAKADLWSVGAVLYEMVTGRPPFRAQNHIELLKKIQENNDQIHFPDERHHDIIIGSDLKDLIRKLLRKDPVERISFQDFFSHPAVMKQPQQQIMIQRSRESARERHNSNSVTPPTTSTSYEPPPFAQPSNRRWSSNTNTPIMRVGEDIIRKSPDNYNNSPLYTTSNRNSHGRLTITSAPVSARDNYNQQQQHPWTNTTTTAAGTNVTPTCSSPSKPNPINSGTTRHTKGAGEEEDMLQEYVVLDRRIIETNQFADELDASPKTTSMPMISGSPGSIESHHSYKRLSRSPSSAVTTTAGAVNIPMSPSTPPFVRERKTSTGSSAGSALAKALSKASVRLFGTSMPSPPKDHGLHMTAAASTNANAVIAGSPHGFMVYSTTGTTTRNRTMKHIERLACMAHAVSKYGDQKYQQLTAISNNNNEDAAILADEAVVLYLKALAILELGLNVAQQYWQQYNNGMHRLEEEEEEEEEQEEKDVMTLLNDAVQWMRDKFNECLKRAESIKDKHTIETSCVEKLLYDRALEMSRAAAVHELVGENINECEQDYQTAIWMLEAILQVRPSDEVTIEQDDRRIINKFIDSIRHRITVLRKKMEMSETCMIKKN